MKIKIMYLSHTAKMGGAEKSLYNLIKNIDKEKFEPILVCGESGELTDSIKKLDVETHIIPMMQINTKYKIKGIYRLIKTSIKLKKFIEFKNIDVLHNNTYRARFYGTIAGNMARIKVITHVRDIMHWTKVEKRLAKYEDCIIAISDAVKKHIFKQIDEVSQHKVVRIYNGVDVEEFDPNKFDKFKLKKEYNLNNDKFIIGVVGRFDEWKRFDLIIEAANNLKDDYKNLVFFIVGEAFDDDEEKVKINLKQLIKQYNLEDRVIFTGYRSDINEVMNGLDLFVLTSDNEPFGRVLIEALALNLPVVSTNNGGAPEIIINGSNGILVDYNNSEKLTKGIENIINNTSLRNSMKSNNRIYAKDKFSIQTHVKLVQELYCTK